MKTNKPIFLTCFTLALLIFFAADRPLFAEQYEYNSQGRLTKVTYDNGSSITYTYDATGNITETKVAQMESFTLLLEQGWNLVSFPVQPTDPAPAAVMSPVSEKCDSVWSYDWESGWSIYIPGAPTALEMIAGPGYWIRMNEACNLTISGIEPQSTEIFLKGGEWNLVGYMSQESKGTEDCMLSVGNFIDSVWDYDWEDGWSIYIPGIPSVVENMKPGDGYWIRADEDCVWDINNP